jgi:hypothetical protein
MQLLAQIADPDLNSRIRTVKNELIVRQEYIEREYKPGLCKCAKTSEIFSNAADRRRYFLRKFYD